MPIIKDKYGAKGENTRSKYVTRKNNTVIDSPSSGMSTFQKKELEAVEQKLEDEAEQAEQQDPLQPLKDLLGTFETMEQYRSGASAISDILNDLPEGEDKIQAIELLRSKRKSLRSTAPPAKSSQEEPVQSADTPPEEVEPEVGKRVAAAKAPEAEEVATNNKQLEELFRAYSDFESEFMDVPTLREQGNLLAALIQALSSFEKAPAERAALEETKGSDLEEIDVETKVDLRKSVDGIKDSMFRVLKVLKQYKRKMFDLDSGDVKKVVVSALNNIQEELKRAYEALQDELGQERTATHLGTLEEQVTDESIAQVRKAYNTILSAVSQFYNEAQKGRYKVSFRDSTFAKAREAIKDIQDYFPQVSPFSTGQSIDEITPQLSKVFMKLRPVMDEFASLAKQDASRRDTIKKFMERIKDVSLEINNLFGVETEIPQAAKELTAAPAETTKAPASPEAEQESEPPSDEEEAAPEAEEDEEEITPPQVLPTAAEEIPAEEEFEWLADLDIEEEYKNQLKRDDLRNQINKLIGGPLEEATPKLRTLGAKAKGMVPSKLSFLAKTLDKFEIGKYTPKTLLKALKKANPKYVIALNLIPKDKLEGYLKNWVGLKLRIQPEDIRTLADWKKYTAYLYKQKDLLGDTKEAPTQAIESLFDFLQANKQDIKFKEGSWAGAPDPYDIKEIEYDENKDEITLSFGPGLEPVTINRTTFRTRVGQLIDAEDDSLQEQILKLITPIVREQIRGGNG